MSNEKILSREQVDRHVASIVDTLPKKELSKVFDSLSALTSHITNVGVFSPTDQEINEAIAEVNELKEYRDKAVKRGHYTDAKEAEVLIRGLERKINNE